MEASERICVDSNYFIALFNREDSLYLSARRIADFLDIQEARLVISNFIFLEIVTVLSQRRGKSASCAAGSFLLVAPFIEIVHIDSVLQEESWNIFQKMSSKNVSFVDCSTIALMQAEDVNTVITFDRTDFSHFKKYFSFTFFGI